MDKKKRGRPRKSDTSGSFTPIHSDRLILDSYIRLAGKLGAAGVNLQMVAEEAKVFIDVTRAQLAAGRTFA